MVWVWLRSWFQSDICIPPELTARTAAAPPPDARVANEPF
jgi:hypothetical protein